MDSTPDISREATQTNGSSESEGDSQNSVEGTQLPTTRVQYGRRVELLADDPQWSEQERHERFRVMMGVPEGTRTSLVREDKCAQSDSAPDWILSEEQREERGPRKR
jgi:hypothetical protein